jgi:hypothetical protein
MATKDEKGPGSFIVEIRDSSGRVWGMIHAGPLTFVSGSAAYYGDGNIVNPDNVEAVYHGTVTVREVRQ